MAHVTIINETDAVLREAMETLNSKIYLLPYDSTAENVAVHVAEAMRGGVGETRFAARRDIHPRAGLADGNLLC